MSNDWRETLFGNHIQLNQDKKGNDEESPKNVELIPTADALNEKEYEYIAVFIGADYCPHCKKFAPTVVKSAEYLNMKKCKVLFASNDRTPEAFEASVKKNFGIDIIPYNLDKTKAMRDLFGLKTIPALMILRNTDFSNPTPQVVTNARNILEEDPKAKRFPWTKDDDESPENMSAFDRIFINGKYGHWWELGHHVNPEKPGQVYMDEHAVRARAGLLNVISWIAIMNVFHMNEPIYVRILFPLVSFEFVTSIIFGLTPIAPLGLLGSLIATVLHPKAFWKPARPKRFAWFVGLCVASSCFTLFQYRTELGDWYKPLVATTVILCNVFTWFESSCGFCAGCFFWNTWIVPAFKLEECSECKL